MAIRVPKARRGVARGKKKDAALSADSRSPVKIFLLRSVARVTALKLSARASTIGLYAPIKASFLYGRAVHNVAHKRSDVH